ncbi:DUF6891 domain-containing protein [Pseudoxanthomonas gei]|nr:hypothetical protein [Pseudoxanthomonas gei]
MDMDMDPEFVLVGEVGLLVRREVAAGFSTRAEIIKLAVDRFEGEAKESELRALAQEMAASSFYKHYKAQIGWPLVTDCERLDIAFDKLAGKDIVTRHNFECDLDDEEYIEDIVDEMDKVIASGKRARGYAFYHRLDVAVAVEGGGLCISFGTGSRNESEEGAVRIGNEVADALRLQGLAVDWSGSWKTRITVWLDWKRRRPWSEEE